MENLRGIGLMIAAMALFAIEDMFLKWAAVGLPIGQIVFITALIGMPVFALLSRREGKRVIAAAAVSKAVLARNFGEMVGTMGYITALASVPLSTVSAVLQTMPLAVTMGAALFMQEKVGWRRWSAIAVGFSGVLMVIRPGMDGFDARVLWVLLTVAGLTLRDLASRAIPPQTSTSQVSAWGLGSLVLLGALIMLWGGAIRPTGLQTAILLGTTLFGTAGYWAITAATRTGEVAVVSPFRYARLVFAIIIGTFVFAEHPDRQTLIGAGLIVASGLYSFARERARKRMLSLQGRAG